MNRVTATKSPNRTRFAPRDRLAAASLIVFLFGGLGLLISAGDRATSGEPGAKSRAPIVFSSPYGRLARGRTYVDGECRRFDVNAPSYYEPPIEFMDGVLASQDAPDYLATRGALDRDQFERATTLREAAYSPLEIGATFDDSEELAWIDNGVNSDWAKEIYIPERTAPEMVDARAPAGIDDSELQPFDGEMFVAVERDSELAEERVSRYMNTAGFQAESVEKQDERESTPPKSSGYVNPTRQASYDAPTAPYGAQVSTIRLY